MSIDWQNAKSVKTSLLDDGWVSPDTYDGYFTPITDSPAVYLFLQHDAETFERAFFAYVGMSENLKNRMSGHPIFADLWRPGYWPQRWFKAVETDRLREVEVSYIRKFDPPWNVQGRKRGVDLP